MAVRLVNDDEDVVPLEVVPVELLPEERVLELLEPEDELLVNVELVVFDPDPELVTAVLYDPVRPVLEVTALEALAEELEEDMTVCEERDG